MLHAGYARDPMIGFFLPNPTTNLWFDIVSASTGHRAVL